MPTDPVDAAKMRVKMAKADSAWGPYYPARASRFGDDEKIKNFMEKALPVWE